MNSDVVIRAARNAGIDVSTPQAFSAVQRFATLILDEAYLETRARAIEPPAAAREPQPQAAEQQEQPAQARRGRR